MDTCDQLIALWKLLNISLVSGPSLHDKLISAGFDTFQNINDMSCLSFAVGYVRSTRKPAAIMVDLSTCSVQDLSDAVEDARELPVFLVIMSPVARRFGGLDLRSSVFPTPLTRMVIVQVLSENLSMEMTSAIATTPISKNSPLSYLDPRIQHLQCYIENCFRPVLLIGDGVSSIAGFPKTIPLVATRHSIGIVPQNHFFMGRFGHDGDRLGNFVVQNADLVIIVGTIPIEHPEWFVREGHVIWVYDTPSFPVHLHFHQNPFMDEWVRFKRMSISDWLSICRGWKKKWMLALPPSCHESNKIHPYVLQCIAHQVLPENKTIIARSDDHWWIPIFQHHTSGRLLCTSMPDVVFFAAGVATRTQEDTIVAVFLGDTDCFRIEDIQYVIEHHLPMIIIGMHSNHYSYGFRCNDRGFLDRMDHPEPLADDVLTLEQISDMTGIRTLCADNHDDLLEAMQGLFPLTEPVFLDVETDPSFIPFPKGNKNKPYEVMEPFLLGEHNAHMLIPPVIDS